MIVKTCAATAFLLTGAQAVHVWLPEIFLHAYYALLVIGAVYAGLVQSKSSEHIVVACVLFFSYVFENNPSYWHHHIWMLSLVHAGLALTIATLCSESFRLYFIGIYLAKSLAGLGLTLSLIESLYVYHVVVNVLSVLGLVWFIFLARDCADEVRLGNRKDDVGPMARRVSWMMKKTAENWLSWNTK